MTPTARARLAADTAPTGWYARTMRALDAATPHVTCPRCHRSAQRHAGGGPAHHPCRQPRPAPRR